MKRIGDWASRHPWGGISIALVVGIALGVSTTPSGENEAAKADLASAEASYNSSQQELSTAQAETSELESSNANLASEVQNLEGRLDSLSGKLEMIRSRQPLASLLGLTRAQMLEMGDANGWNLIFSKEISSATAGTIISQNPGVGTQVQTGSTIRINLAKAAPEPKIQDPAPVADADEGAGCTDGYSPCLSPASDYDCAGGSGDGPKYTGYVTVTGSDPYGLDSDGDGGGCES